ncbi:S9 family peptidase [Saccharothrix sp. S26]|uniref:alpha/beta hydrolase family protein n=1 Tax=Saccharothrix sp. S26 TaxID=2907215 RepID=UPI001F1AC089|nr:prolyl oligopeptidase family serine peptidase [Saccharothrix sp. S26]MCE6996967.1 S9 family peptidase [Saccharothrix sp. S26]
MMRTTALVVAAIAALGSAAPAAAGTGVPITMPEPSGHHAVGTVDLHLVDRRPDPWRPADRREVMVTVTYPAHRSDAARAPWMSSGVAAAVDVEAAKPEQLGVPSGSVDWGSARRHARTGAPVLGRWPVVLFSPGFGSPRELNAGITDDLAGRGYVVVSLSHTHESLAVEFPGGRVVLPSVDPGDPALVTTALEARVADTRFVLDELERVARGHNPDAEGDPLPRGLGRALDLSRVGVFGHSYGGFTAGEAMVRDRRFDAGINVDGAMAHGTGPGEVVTRGLDRPFMLVGADFLDPATGTWTEHSHRTPEFDPTWAQFWSNQRGWKRDLHFDRGTHYGFTDLQFAVPQMGGVITPDKRREVVGEIDATRSLAAQHDYFAAFFDLHLKGRDGGLFRGDSPRHPDVRFIG